MVCFDALRLAMTVPRRETALSRHDRVRVMLQPWTPLITEGAGKAGNRLMPMPPCNKKHGEGTTGSAGRPGLPCAMVLRLVRALLGDRAFLPPLLASAQRAACERSLSVGRPGPHDFAVRARISRLAQKHLRPARPSHPASRFVTIAHTPPLPRWEAGENASDLGAPSSLFLNNRI
jgi:hypothetical protein